MKKTINFVMLAMSVWLVTSCNKQITEKQVDYNKPTSVPANLILGTVLTDISGTGSAGALNGINSWSSVSQWNQFYCSNYDYYGDNSYGWGSGSYDPYTVLKNVNKMDSELTARGGAAVNAYEAVGRFITAYYYYNMTSMFGDIPQAEALQGVANLTPAYTAQADVFKYVLAELDTANSQLATLIAANDNSLSETQDIYFNGNLSKWQKVVNSFKLRVLVALSHKAADLNVPAQFAAIINTPATYPIFTSQDDDLAFVYVSATYSTYPQNPTQFGSIAARQNMAKTYVDAVKLMNDPRVFATCEPASGLLGGDPNPAQFKFFAGASTGEPLATMYNNANAGKYSFINRKRYFSTYVGEPDVLVGFKEMCFNIAEGIERGWATGTAETWYKKGITESMGWYGIDVTQDAQVAYFLPSDKTSVDETAAYPYTFNFDDYYAQDSVKLSATQATAVKQIVKQKYINSFVNSGWEAYFNWRRTGVPAFLDGVGVGNGNIVPVRWAYPSTEQTQNSANWSAALSNQGYAADDLNQKMWLIK